MVVTLVHRLRDGMDVGRRVGARNRCGQSEDNEDNRVAQDGISVHRIILRDARIKVVRARHQLLRQDRVRSDAPLMWFT